MSSLVLPYPCANWHQQPDLAHQFLLQSTNNFVNHFSAIYMTPLFKLLIVIFYKCVPISSSKSALKATVVTHFHSLSRMIMQRQFIKVSGYKSTYMFK